MIIFLRTIPCLVLPVEVVDDFGMSRFHKSPFFTQLSEDLHNNPVSVGASPFDLHINSILAVYTFFTALSYQSLPYRVYSEDH